MITVTIQAENTADLASKLSDMLNLEDLKTNKPAATHEPAETETTKLETKRKKKSTEAEVKAEPETEPEQTPQTESKPKGKRVAESDTLTAEQKSEYKETILSVAHRDKSGAKTTQKAVKALLTKFNFKNSDELLEADTESVEKFMAELEKI